MPKGIAHIQVRKRRGHMIVSGFGQTSKGQKYVKETVTLKATSPQDKEFKSELAAAVAKITGDTPE